MAIAFPMRTIGEPRQPHTISLAMAEDPTHRLPERDRPWMMRTYAGHSTAARSNELYRRNLAKGQTGLSIAFDLPTQTGYDPDDELARGEVGKVGVPVAHRDDMRALLDGILDAVRERVPAERMDAVFGRISFFVNAGVRFVEEHAKLRAMAALWDELGRERYAVADERHRRFRYGVQVNSLGLTESQPENNVYRIALEALSVTLGRSARARAIQLPAWNEALGLPRPWDQQWSLRLQQILAYETDLLEYPDVFEGSKVMEGLVHELVTGARREMEHVAELGGAVDAVDYMKAALVDSHRERWRRIEADDLVVVGMNRFTSGEPSPLTADADGGILVVDPQVEAEQRAAVRRWRAERDRAAVDEALAELARVGRDGSENIVAAPIAAARAGAT